jgi:DNA gyrase/topoisomerase IV subunit A
MSSNNKAEVVRDQEVLKQEMQILLNTCLSPIITIIYCYLQNKGRCFWLRAFEIPEASKTSQGRVYTKHPRAYRADDKIRAYIKIEKLK